jgi:hypothetical protein
MSPIRITALGLAVVWTLGVATSMSGGFIHLLAALAVALLLVELVKSRRARH